MNGGNVSNRPTINIAKAATLTRTKPTSRAVQSLDNPNQATSHTTIAARVAPDKSPDGGQMVNACRTTGDASLASAKTPSAPDPVPADRIAAAPGPLGQRIGSCVAFMVSLMLFKQDDFMTAAHGRVFVQERTKPARHRGREERNGRKAKNRAPHMPVK